MLNELFILSKIKEGDIKAFEEVFHRYYSPLCWYAAGIIGQMEVAEEIVEELFYVFWRERENLQIFCSVKSYLYGAVRNEVLQYCEHRGGTGIVRLCRHRVNRAFLSVLKSRWNIKNWRS